MHLSMMLVFGLDLIGLVFVKKSRPKSWRTGL